MFGVVVVVFVDIVVVVVIVVIVVLLKIMFILHRLLLSWCGVGCSKVKILHNPQF